MIESSEKPDITNLVRTARLMRLRLVTADMWTRILQRKEAGDAEIMTSETATITGSGDKWLTVQVMLISDIHGRSDASQQFVHVSATYEAHYQYGDMSPSTEVLERFARENGVFNVWPYFREFVQSCTTRMGLPALTLPLKRYTGVFPRPSVDAPASSPQISKQPEVAAGGLLEGGQPRKRRTKAHASQ